MYNHGYHDSSHGYHGYHGYHDSLYCKLSHVYDYKGLRRRLTFLALIHMSLHGAYTLELEHFGIKIRHRNCSSSSEHPRIVRGS